MNLDESTAILARTPSVLQTLLGDLAPGRLQRDDGPDTWSAHDIVSHLLAGEIEDWLPRTKIILEHGTDIAFEPFDRAAMFTWEADSPAALLHRFKAARVSNLEELTALHLSASDLQLEGRHPDLGVVTLAQLLSTWVAHDLTHLAQISEVIARDYAADVGPWRQFLPALDRSALAE